MPKHVFALSTLLLGLSIPAAHADTIATFSATGGGYFDSAPLSGSAIIDTTTGVIETLALTVPAGTYTQRGTSGTIPETLYSATSGATVDINGSFNLVGYAGSLIAFYPNEPYFGTLTFVSSYDSSAVATAEPPSALLLGTACSPWLVSWAVAARLAATV